MTVAAVVIRIGRSRVLAADESLIVLGDRREVLEREFEDVRTVAEVGHPYAMRQEHFTVFLCQRPRRWTLQSLWPRVKNWQ